MLYLTNKSNPGLENSAHTYENSIYRLDLDLSVNFDPDIVPSADFPGDFSNPSPHDEARAKRKRDDDNDNLYYRTPKKINKGKIFVYKLILSILNILLLQASIFMNLTMMT